MFNVIFHQYFTLLRIYFYKSDTNKVHNVTYWTAPKSCHAYLINCKRERSNNISVPPIALSFQINEVKENM